MVGFDNTCNMLIGGVTARYHIDTGSMITTMSRDIYIKFLQDRHPLLRSGQILKVEGAGGQEIPFDGYVEVDVMTCESDEQLYVPILVQATQYNAKVPIIILTNVLKSFREQGVTCKVPALQSAINFCHVNNV